LKWRAFRHGQNTYDLTHLDPRHVIYVQQAREGKPERHYRVDVTFALHCFTRGLKAGEQPDHALLYSDPRETRVFDFRRYALSFQLSGIIDTLLEQKCFHTGQGNFFTVKLIDENGAPVEYEVFFKAYKREKNRALTLIVESAYVRDEGHSKRPAAKAIGFHVILFNTVNNKPIRIPN
jgi:hypothetical protein